MTLNERTSELAKYQCQNCRGKFAEPITVCPLCKARQITERSENEAAERLREWIPTAENAAGETESAETLEDALAAERSRALAEHAEEDEKAIAAAFQAGERRARRATVERLRQAFKDYRQEKGTSWVGWIDRVLDEEAAR